MFKQATRKLKLFKRPTLQISNNILNQPGVDMSLYVSPTQQYNFNWKTIDHICSSDMGLPKKFKKKRFSLHRHFPCCLLLALSIIILKNRTWERSSCGSVGKTSEQFNQGGSEKYFARSYFWLVSFSHWGSARRKSPQSPDLLALMDFAVWGLDYSQPKTDLFFKQKTFMNVRHVTSSFSVDRPCLNADRSPNQDEEYDGDTLPRNVHFALDGGDHIGGHQPLGTWVHPCRLKLRVCRSQDQAHRWSDGEAHHKTAPGTASTARRGLHATLAQLWDFRVGLGLPGTWDFGSLRLWHWWQCCYLSI